MNRLLTIEDLCVDGVQGADGKPARIVDSVSVAVSPGEVVALIGESGAGKTTVALAALAYARPGTRIVAGRVVLAGTDLLALPPRQRRHLRGRQVAYVAQSAASALNPAKRLDRQIAEPIYVHGLAGRASAMERVRALLRALRLPEEVATRYPHQVSGGQQQRLITAMAMGCSPALLVFDEPTTALDTTTQLEVLKVIKDAVRDLGCAALYVSHDLAVVAQIADRCVVMRGGRIVEEGAMGDILDRPKELYTHQLLAAHRSNSSAAAIPSEGARRPEPRPAAVAVQVRGIVADYRRSGIAARGAAQRPAVAGVDLAVDTGEVVALVGESGSGKSTLARVIAGLHRARAGETVLHGQTLASAAEGRTRDQLRRIQIIYQSPDASLNPATRVIDAIGRPLAHFHGKRGAVQRQRVYELLDLVDLPRDLAFRYPWELSGGQKQRVSIARAFAAEPDILLCDEVLSALDTIVAAAVLDLLRDLQRRFRVACLFISHDLATVRAIADRVVVLREGAICEQGTVERVFDRPEHPYTRLLLDAIPQLRRGWLEDALASRAARADSV